jgi:hypothetical protein
MTAVPTAACAALQTCIVVLVLVLRNNLDALMAGQLQQDTAAKYDGYTSCPVSVYKCLALYRSNA